MSKISDVSKAVTDLDDAVSAEIETIDRAELTSDLSPIPVSDTPNEYQNPWDRLASESEYAWDIFSYYRDLGLSRDFEKVRDYVDSVLKRRSRNGKKLNPNNVHVFSKRYRWKERVFAYDTEQERLYQLARSEAIREMASRHEGVVEKAITGLMAPIEALTSAMESDPNFISNLSKTDAKKLIDLSNRAARTIPSLMAAERLARGMPTEIVGGVVEHQHIVSVERDHIGEILAVLGQAGVLNVGGPDSGVGEIVDAEVVDVHPVSAEGDD